jgi:hypothetical protein
MKKMGLVMAMGLAAGYGAAGCGAPGSDGTSSGGTTTTGTTTGTDTTYAPPPWLSDAKILVSGETTDNQDCTKDVCRHSENTDLINWHDAIYLVHRTAKSQILGDNSSLRILKSADGGKTFDLQAILAAPTTPPMGRDIRDPHFYVVGDKLYIKTLCRLPVLSKRDSDVDTLPQWTSSADGKTWTPLQTYADKNGMPWSTHSFWRIKQQAGVYYSAAYLDGDKSVTLFSSKDGVVWEKGPDVYTVAEDTPLETELAFMPSGKLLALVRMDGTDDELLGDVGRLRTKLCWSAPPYSSFSCPDEFMGQRLDGPLTFFHDGRLFVVARKHLGKDDRKRTSLFEITGMLEGGPLSIKELGELPSAGDTSYAGVATIDPTHALVTWYSGNLDKDEGWIFGMLDITDIWQGTLDFSKLP